MKKSHAVADRGVWKSVIAGVSASCATAVIIVGIIAALILHENLTIPQLQFIIPGLHFAAIFVGGIIAGIAEKERKILTITIMSGVVYFLCTVMTILLFDGQFGSIVADFVLGLLGALCALLVQRKRMRIGQRQFRKRKIC